MSILAIVTAAVYALKVTTIKVGVAGGNEKETKKLLEISSAISEGAMAFLVREYKVISVFIAFMAVLIVLLLDNPATEGFNDGLHTAIAFIAGAIISCLSGFIGMKIATAGNVRTAEAAKTSLSKAFRVAFDSGAVMGFGLVGLAILGMIILFLLFTGMYPTIEKHFLMESLAGFGLGGSAVALFGRVGGGIYTKAADVGADLVGKVEKGIPEDDPRNPATIADNVGDNVGDVAGMGADLFGSCAEATCAALVIGATASALSGSVDALLYPLLISAFGIPASLLTSFLARVKEGGNVESALKVQLWVSTLFVAGIMYFVTNTFMVDSFEIAGKTITKWDVYISMIVGLFSGMFIGIVTEYYTSHSYKPVREVAEASNTGAATNIIYGLSLGYHSSVIPVILLVITIVTANLLAGMYGIAIAALGMISTIAIGLTIDAYGPVSDNAGGIAEMAELGKDVRDRTDTLDAAGNTTAAIGKGFAIGSAALTSLALFAAFITRTHTTSLEVLNAEVFGGLMFGAMLPFLFTAMTMKSVGKAAVDMVEEVRKQFREIPGIMEGKNKPDYKRCVDISTTAALREMILPGLLVLLTPVLVGYLFGVKTLAGVLAGALVAGVVLAISAANSGGGWDNAKKYIEKKTGGKGSDQHKAAVVGDTVGDPFKDTSGPSINILIKLMAITSLVFAEFFVQQGGLLMRLFHY
ncbi:V-type H(+)-translocating pyrophosphatase [Leptospira borgpetersenii serovar Pomona str. 200901868]|uniref:Putative K(+)-stimulated pyrophosphate-energized sodium pump n=4 Tax=Leptospira borgpetersenii TaxID=174 RepID=M6W3C4_LEPBO|nr:V-type H(+)-translocating pyrophosphatase [Leptospira borgpetersenii str. 200801926]EKQ99355.1 V-type H(+)-translocating pyrophosphatase [Leptospira borgpetersenii serovar Castellonis str. 200801910]EMN12706.1 V-type H(+)-translocating pyrophosphatase [Leptospira borgpetersenii str. Brem 307]EMN15517.1 V-type H(+)-translocating pyrophosphatase [Leptospira borgpetersenii str. Brem 328]EMO61946.1 V-type H(+)-translocating pyrophosphatase [Leptospira borgpetersenii serovar Pomona str. 200901868